MTEQTTMLTKEQAISLYASGFWHEMSHRERAVFQMEQDRLCMPFGVFHEAVSEALGRPVWTHEFADADRLRAELYGEKPAPSMQEIIDMIPADKRVILVTQETRND